MRSFCLALASSFLIAACGQPAPPPACTQGQCDGGRPEAGSCGPCATPPGPCHRAPGACWNGECRYDLALDGAPCDDKDGCTSGDVCVAGACKGKSMSCTQPPSNSCKDPTTLISYASPGTCAEAQCSYTSTEVPCPSGCASGSCGGDPCATMKCDAPPTPQCFTVPGTCAAGKCTYQPKADATCDDGNLCTHTDRCDATGKCAGTLHTCDDNLTCTTDGCDGAGNCTATIATGHCLISGPVSGQPGYVSVCYGKGALKTGNPCESCDPAKSTSAWSPPAGTTVQTWNFDTGLQGFTVSATTSAVKWQLDTKRADSGTSSLYFGNLASHTYDDPGKAVSGQVTSPVITPPSNAGKLCLVFKMWKQTEEDQIFDQLRVFLLPSNNEIFLSGTEPKNATTGTGAPPTYGFRSFAAAIPAASAGTAVQFRFRFDSGDANNNTTEGVYLDTIQVLRGCTP